MSQLELFSDEPSSASPSDFSQDDFPPYKVRESNRAKHVSIKISVEGEVEVVIPPQFDRVKLPEILERRRSWVLNTRSRLLKDRTKTVDNWQIEKPEKIVFRWRSSDLDEGLDSRKSNKKGLGSKDGDRLETWTIRYVRSPGNRTTCIPEANNRLLVTGNIDPLNACQGVLRKWLAHRAQRDLAPWLRKVGFEIDLPCNQISVRGQKTIWASCSSQKNISLNYKLLFLPRPLVRYVLVHELCHTVHMNHSRSFWALVEEKQADYKWRDEALKKAWRYVPRWVEGK
jgi:predicted metal-dependent hydrolase